MLKELQLDETFIKLCITQQGWQIWFYKANIKVTFGLSASASRNVNMRFAIKSVISGPPQIQLMMTRPSWGSFGHSDLLWIAFPAACGWPSLASGCCWRSHAASRPAPPSLCWGWPPSARRGWKHTAPERKTFKLLLSSFLIHFNFLQSKMYLWVKRPEIFVILYYKLHFFIISQK